MSRSPGASLIDAEAHPIRYEQDSYGWALQQVELLRAEKHEALDLAHIAQVLAGLAAQDRAKLGAAIAQILEALLKWDFAPDARERGWGVTIHQQRRRVLKQIRRQPGLMSAEAEATRHAYGVAREAVIAHVGLDAEALPAACPYSWAQMMERDIEWLGA